MRRFLLTLAIALVASPDLRADWPQSRGPNRDGHAVGARLPAKWPESVPRPTWRANVGEGHAGAKDRVVIGGASKSTLCVKLTLEGEKIKKELAWKMTT